MTTLNRGPATIYAFPPRGRFAAGRQLENETSAASPRIANVLSASGWYHEEAMRDAEGKLKN